MFCNLHIESTGGNCGCGRITAAIWAYLKLIADILLLSYVVSQTIYFTFFGPTNVSVFFHIIVTTQLIIDVIFQIKLLSAYNKKKEQELISYYKYTKVLWIFWIALSIIIIMCYANDSMHYLSRYRFDSHILTYTFVTFITVVCQALIWHKVMKPQEEIEGEPKRGFKFLVQIGELVEKDTEKGNDIEEIVTTDEKVKLTE